MNSYNKNKMVYLPNDVLNLIFSFREVNPTSKFILNSKNDFENSIYDSNYKHALMRAQEKIYVNNVRKLQKYYGDKSEIIKRKKLARKKLEKENANYTKFEIGSGKHNANYENFYRKFT